jgi:hypothetical protein
MSPTRIPVIVIALLGLAASLLSSRSLAEPVVSSALFSRSGARAAVPDSRLADVRGGFESADGSLRLSIGVQRQVLVDGNVVAVSTLHLCEPGCAAVGSGGGLSVIQRGAGNSMTPLSVSVPASAIVVQNTLDQQKLQALTTIDVTANSLQLYKGSALQAAVGSVVAASARR